jgi:LmbE family N-acetylglucosaminyl deacetylase
VTARPPRHLVVLSPHLDDAALSLGATIARATRLGDRVTVVTVFANDPEVAGPARPWDRACGFASAPAAARARRAEDAAACALLGARPVWLAFADRDHGDGRTDAVWEAVAAAVQDADVVLAPGWPLHHPDHAWVAGMALGRAPLAPRVGLYVEQPYAVDRPLLSVTRRARGGASPRPPKVVTAGEAPVAVRWQSRRPRPRDWLAKQRAIGAYRSQLGELGPAVRARIAAYEAVLGAEAICWPTPASAGSA